MIKFILPNFYYNSSLNATLRNLYQVHPNFFRFKDIKFIGEMGNFPYSYWGLDNYNSKEKNQIPYYNDYYNIAVRTRNFPIFFDCRNSLLLPIDFYDNRMNNILSLFQNGSNKIIISSIELGLYLKEHFPYYPIVGDNFNTNKFDLDYLLINYNNIHKYNIPNNKLIINLVNYCNSCPIEEQEKCQKIFAQENMAFIKNSLQRQCSKINYSPLNFEIINNLIDQGYRNYYFNTTFLNFNNIDSIINLYLSIFIKSEYKEQSYLMLKLGAIK